MSTTKEDRSFKTLINREITDSVNKFFFNELGADTINVHADDLWLQTIAFNDPSQAVTDGVAELRTLFVLTEDPTVPASQTFKAVTTPGDISSASLRDWISPKFGNNFEIRLFDNNDVEIFTTDPVDWFFEYQTGILTFNGNAQAKVRPFKVTGYRFIGDKGVGAGVLTDATEENFTVAIDSAGGSDPATTIRIRNQAESDAWGAFATVPGVIQSLPEYCPHILTLDFPDGTFVLDSEFFGEYARLRFGFSGTHDIFIGPLTSGAIRFRSLNGLIRETATTTYPVSASSTARQVVLQSDPGFAVDAHQSKYLRVISGTGAGQLKAIRTHTGVNFDVAASFSPVLDATSVVEIVRGAAEMTVPIVFPTVRGDQASTSIPSLIFDAIDLRGTQAFSSLVLVGPTLSLENGARILDMGLNLTGASTLMSECVIDTGGQNISVILQSSHLRASSNGLTWLIRDGIGAGIAMLAGSGQNVNGGGAATFLLDGAIDDIASGFGLLGDGIYVESKFSVATLFSPSTLIQGSGNAGAGIRIVKGGQVLADASTHDAAADALTGTAGDLILDGNVATWNDLDTDPDKTLLSTKQSMINGD